MRHEVKSRGCGDLFLALIFHKPVREDVNPDVSDGDQAGGGEKFLQAVIRTTPHKFEKGIKGDADHDSCPNEVGRFRVLSQKIHHSEVLLRK